MHICELFSIRKSKADCETLDMSFDRVTEALAEQGVDVRYKTVVSADPKKLSTAISSSMKEGKVQLYLFANALNTSDSSSFKDLFYEFVAEQEAGITPDKEHEGMTPKIKIFSLGDLGSGYRGYCLRYDGKVFVAVPYASLTGLDIADLLCLAVSKSADILHASRAKYPDGIAYPEDAKSAKGKKKEGFFMSFIPHKGDTRGSVIRKCVVLTALVAFVIAAGYLLNTFVFAPIQNDSINAEIENIAHRSDNSDVTSETTPDGEPLPEEDWDALKKINKEIVGWVKMDNTPINYPVLYRKSDDENYQYYLDHTYKNEYSEYGSIFVDYRCTKGTGSKNIILHGHNMLNGSMFHELANYADGYSFNPKLDYYKKHSVLTFNTPEGDAKWKVISVFKTSTYFDHGLFFNYMQGDFNSDAEFMNFVYNVRIRSMFNIPVTVNEDDTILTLSTCSYEFSGFRTVLVARKVRPGEDPNVEVQLATINQSPLYPDVYYQANGGTKPETLTFKTANAKGLITWYDGKGNLEGSEDLTATIASNPTEPPTLADGTPSVDPGQSSYTYYFVTYRNYDGSQIASYTVRKGDPVPVPDIIPTYEDDNYTYKFVKWDYNIPGVDFNALNVSVTIYPIYDPILKTK